MGGRAGTKTSRPPSKATRTTLPTWPGAARCGGSEPRERASRSPPWKSRSPSCGPGWRRWGGSRKTRLLAELHRGSDPTRVRASGDAYSSRLHVLGAGLLASQGPAQILFEQRQKVLVAERPAGTLMRAEGFQLVFFDGAGQQKAPVGGHLQQWSDLHQGVITPSQVSRRAAPAIT